MSTDLKWLQGRIAENPREERKDLDRLLVGFLQALVEEEAASVETVAAAESPRSGAV